MSENSRVLKAAGVVGAATLLSRILGFIRDAVFAWYFGAGFSTDAFIAAFRIPNLLRRLFAEGSLSAAFVPVFTDYLVLQGKNEAFALARSGLRLLAVILMAVCVCGILLSPWIVRFVAPGFAADKFSLTVTLTRILFPYIFFIGLVAFCMGILNALDHFAAPALAPVLLNLAVIGSILFLSPLMTQAVIGMAVGVLIGGALQLSLQLPFVIHKGVFFWRHTHLFHQGLKKIGGLLPPVVLSSAVYQINILMGTLLASLLEEGSVTYLYFADRLVQFPLGIFAIAASTAVLPSLSRQASAKDFDALKDTFSHAVKLVFFITVPAMVGLIILREPIVALLFQRGEFDAHATRLTSDALLYYGIGLWAFSAVRIVIATFFALQDTKTPARIAVFSVIANIGLGIVLMKLLAHGGIALATSLASMLNLLLLARALRTRLGQLGFRRIVQSVWRTIISAAMMGVTVWVVSSFYIPSADSSSVKLFFGLMASIITGLGSYGAFSYLLKSRELAGVLAEARKGFQKR